MYNEGHLQAYDKPLLIHNNQVIKGKLKEYPSAYQVIARHSTTTNDKQCTVEQLYIEKDDGSFALNFNIPDFPGDPVDVVQYRYMVGEILLIFSV